LRYMDAEDNIKAQEALDNGEDSWDFSAITGLELLEVMDFCWDNPQKLAILSGIYDSNGINL
jgi:hypothetical protein